MNFFKKLAAFLLCAIISLSFYTTVSADDTPTISVTSVNALPGDSVKISISISDNPGIMAMAFCITYDSDALKYKSYAKGYLSNYNIYNHEDKGHISFVNVENKDINKNGNIVTIIFDVKSNAKPGDYKVTLENSNREKYGTKLHNSFSNSNQEFIVPKVVSGGITVQKTCENSGHEYGEWNIVKEANCTETGLKKRFCIRCNNAQEVDIPITHDFEQEWTIDKEATPQEDGIMSRHCTKCDEVTDKITFSYEEITGDSSDTDVSSDISVGESSSEGIDTQDKKPIINNTVGEKVPLDQAEKLDDYQNIIKPDTNSSSVADDNVSIDDTSSDTNPVNSNGINTNNSSSDKNENKNSYFATTSGIIIIVICFLLSIGIVALGVLLIIRNKKS